MSAQSPQPCSGSILMNPLPSTSSSFGSPQSGSSSNARPRRGSVAVCVSHTAEPPAWFQDAESHQTAYGQSPPKADIKSRSNSVDRWGDDSDSESEDGASIATGQGSSGSSIGQQSVQFAPLPKGKPHRSNSITIGVASRAQMLSGGGNPSNASAANSRQARYAGPQWYSPGGTVPPDVYTYKDIARGLSSVWRKAKGTPRARRASEASVTSSTSAEHALEMERDAKAKGGIEHIEEAVEEEEEEEGAVFSSEDEGEDARGRAAGMSMPAGNASLESSSSEGGHSEESGGALSTSATSQGTTEDVESFEAEARRRAKGKGKLA